MFSNGMIAGVNILAPFVEDWILCMYNCRFIVDTVLVDPSWTVCSSFSTFLNHIIWQTHDDAIMYSASRVERVTIDCFFDDQKNIVFPIKKT